MQFSLKNRAGIGLPIAMGATVIIGMVIAAASFASIQSYRTQRKALFQERALAVAEEGQSRVVQNWSTAWNLIPDGSTVEQRFSFPDGSQANVVLTRLNQYTFWAASEGSVNPTSRLLNARRRTNQIVRLLVPNLRMAAAMSAREATVATGSGLIQGNDANPTGWDCDAPGPPAPGIMTDSLIDAGSGGSCPSGSCITTTAPSKYGADTLLRDTTQYGSAMGFDLLKQQALTAGTGVVLDAPYPARRTDVLTISGIGPTYNMDGSCNKSNTLNWGDPYRTIPAGKCEDYFPTIYIRGDVTSQTSISGGYGQGVLIIDGDVTINGTFLWYGPVIVRGNFKSNGATTGFGVKIIGGVLAANMNCDAASAASGSPCNSISGNTNIQFSRCAITNAVSRNALSYRSTRSWADLF